ncbi:MAG: RNA polymerase sigma factor [Oscillospiraceae bacterium]|jgi:RNA polymerase sigma factor (sigma-70 family)|nr:RNA polymerase sigma factor [Oscillospiraceae bacterium]
MEDTAIVDLYLARDERAISCTAEKYGARLRRIANGILEDASAAEECENDTYLQAWGLIPPHEPRTYLFAFLGKIIRHTAIDRCRWAGSRKRRANLCQLTEEMASCIPEGPSVEQTLEAKDLAACISAYLSGCTPQQRDVFMRRYWFFDTIPEISKRYGFTPGKVKSMLFRMRKGLRDHLEKEGYDL